MHITINTLTKKVIIHDLTLTKTELVVKMLQAIGEDANNYQIYEKDSRIIHTNISKLAECIREAQSIKITHHEIIPLKNLQNPDDGAAMS